MDSNNSASSQQLRKRTTQILHRRPAPSLPTHASVKSNTFLNRFKNKISLTPSAFAFTCVTPDIVNADFPEVNFQIASFKPPTITEVRKIIMSSPSQSGDLKPLPTVLLKACLDELIRPITDIICAPLCSGIFHGDFKCAN